MNAMTKDRGFAAQLAEDLGPDDVRLVLDVFRADLARLSEVMRAAARAGDADGFRRVAHSLAGASGAVGAVALESVCRMAMTRTAIAPAQFLEISAEVDRLCAMALAELTAYVADMDRAG